MIVTDSHPLATKLQKNQLNKVRLAEIFPHFDQDLMVDTGIIHNLQANYVLFYRFKKIPLPHTDRHANKIRMLGKMIYLHSDASCDATWQGIYQHAFCILLIIKILPKTFK